MRTILLVLFALLSSPAWADPGYDIIIIAGQSNALGCGCGPFQDITHANDGKIFQLNSWGWPQAAHEPLRYAPHGDQAGKGFGMTFARLYAAQALKAGRQVLLVPVAVGGTSILQWDDKDEGFDFGPPTNNADPMRYDSTELYDSLVSQTESALRAGGGNNRIVAFLWHQGETDLLFMHQTEQPIHRAMGTVGQYQTRFTQLITKFRDHFAGQNIPLVAGELGRFLEPAFGGENGLAAFNQMLERTSQNVPRMAIGSSIDLGNGVAAHCALWPNPNLPDGDPVHFHAAAQVEFGRRYFSAWQSLPR